MSHWFDGKHKPYHERVRNWFRVNVIVYVLGISSLIPPLRGGAEGFPGIFIAAVLMWSAMLGVHYLYLRHLTKNAKGED